jgi:urease accessory protein
MKNRVNKTEVLFAISTLTLIALIALASPAFAHHALGGQLPSTWVEGFMSGLAHPILGPDHFAFVVAAGLLAVTRPRGMVIPLAFVLAALAGTGLHLMSWTLPAPEVLISTSVLLFGLLLTRSPSAPMAILATLAGLAGIFHGYAYGESIVGAEMSPLWAYLLGFTTIQGVIALSSFKLGQGLLRRRDGAGVITLRQAGLVICGAGAAFLAATVLG